MGFNNAVFLSERETADRNYAMAYYMKEKRCFPPLTKLNATMDLYFQVTSNFIKDFEDFHGSYGSLSISVKSLLSWNAPWAMSKIYSNWKILSCHIFLSFLSWNWHLIRYMHLIIVNSQDFLVFSNILMLSDTWHSRAKGIRVVFRRATFLRQIQKFIKTVTLILHVEKRDAYHWIDNSILLFDMRHFFST